MNHLTPGNPFGDALQLPPRSADARHMGVLGDYRILEIRRGGMGEVYICTNPDAEESALALKTFQKRLFFHPAARHAFVREVAIWLRLCGEPHIMPVAGLEYIKDQPFVLMPAIDISLRDLFEDGPLSGTDVLRVAFETAVAMKAAEVRLGQVVHGDLKPENILVTPAGLLVSDFGLARVVAESEPDLELEGTWAYRAPECWTGRPTSVASDLYAYGAIVYEAVVGRPPFSEVTPEGWARAHRYDLPPRPSPPPGDAVSAKVLELAFRCLAKDPNARPGFGVLVSDLRSIMKSLDPVGSLMVLMESAQMREAFREMRAQAIPNLVQSLLDLEEYDLALAELEAVPDDAMTDRLLRLRGDALSLTERDQEAVTWFERALERNLDEAERFNCLSSYALSLKRLGRFEDAIAIYRQLIGEVPDDALPFIYNNLATVYLESGQPEQAVSTLINASRANPAQPALWANLGNAYAQLDQLEQAAHAYRRALAAAPHRGDIQLLLARVALRLGRLAEAEDAIQAAYDQGHNSRQWLVLAQACYRLLGRAGYVAELVALARRYLTPAQVAELEAEVEALVQEVRSR